MLGFFIVLLSLGGCSDSRPTFSTLSIAAREVYLADHIDKEDVFSVHDLRVLQTTFFYSCMFEIRLISGELQITYERFSNEQIIKKEYEPNVITESEIRNLLYLTLQFLEKRERGEITDEELIKATKQSRYIVAFAKGLQSEYGIPAAMYDATNRKILLKLLQETQRIHQR